MMRPPRWSVVKNPPARAGDVGLTPGLGRPPGEGNDNLLQQSCLKNPMDRGAWWATVHGVSKSQTLLGNWAFTHYTIFLIYAILKNGTNSLKKQTHKYREQTWSPKGKRWEGSVRGLGLTHTYTHTTRYKMGNQQEKHRKLDSVSHNDL